VLWKKKQGGCWKLQGDRYEAILLFDFTQVFHKIESLFDLLNTIRKNMSKSEQTDTPDLLELK
jgi:hypothetical protein